MATPTPTPIRHPGEETSDNTRYGVSTFEPRALRTYTPTQAVIERSAGVYHWTPEGKRLFDYTSGVLVANLGHNPTAWLDRFHAHMGWSGRQTAKRDVASDKKTDVPSGFTSGVPLTCYNAITPPEVEACRRLVALLRSQPGGRSLEQVMWAASGSEAIQKALWVGQARDRTRPMILATRHGFHGKKGLSNAVTGSESDSERDPRVRFISFPMAECRDVSQRNRPFDPTPYKTELDALWHQFGRKIGTLITEPYLGGGGSYHPPREYLQLLNAFCRENDVVFILDEVQSNFGRTGDPFAYVTCGLEPDIVVLGKGLGNGVPVSAAVGRSDLFGSLDYGEASDTWSGNPLSCAAVLATLAEYENDTLFAHLRTVSRQLEARLIELKKYPFVANVRGEDGGMVWGVEFADHDGRTANEWANRFILEAYRGATPGGDGVHLLGPLAKRVVRIAPPLVISADEVDASTRLLHAAAERLATRAG